MKERDMVHGWLKEADIEPNGSRPWDIQIHNEKLYQRVLAQGSLGFGEAYMDGWWDAEKLDELLSKLLSSGIDKKVMNWRTALYAAKAVVVNLGSRGRAFDIGEHHYDTGNELYVRMLDPRMTYTCGYWNGGAQTLEEAQEAKLDLICKKLRLEPGMRLLDIGGGWGSLTIFAAERYGVEAVNVTVSKEQLALGQQKAEERGVADKVEMRYQDYRAVDDGPYDRIASVGMFEHVGYKNYRDFMEVAYRLLKEEGLFLLHTIGGNKSVKTT
ncbi:MAG: class I SAM-dependent methyltransferase, partial [Candidatus Andersenbacteria bacterium]|nr:class I SAM-dependent methyltransferase [Candidatus Andersenbacteria bacterium]